MAIDAAFPSELRELFLESNGVTGPSGVQIVWPVEEIRRVNLLFRDTPDCAHLYQPFTHLVFFADVGNGDMFGLVDTVPPQLLHQVAFNFGLTFEAEQTCTVYLWHHETDERVIIASSLQQYIERVLGTPC